MSASSTAALKGVWVNLPALGLLNLALALALVPAGLLAAGGAGLFVPVAALIPIGIAAAVVASGRWGESGLGRQELRAALRPGLLVGGTVGGVLTLAVGTLQLYRATGAAWLLGPLFLDGAAVTLSALAGVYAVPLALGALRGRPLWTTALAFAGSDIPATVSCAFMFGVSAALVLFIGPGLLLLLPAPVLFATHSIVRDVMAKERNA